MHVDNILRQHIDSIPIEAIANKLGLHPVRHKMLCVFHKEKTPSLSFNVRENRFHCFGCGASGDAITLVMRVCNLSYPDAVEWIARQFSIYIPGAKDRRHKVRFSHPVLKQSSIRGNEKRSTDEDVLNWVIETAKLSEKVKYFLYVERKYSPEVCEELKLCSISNSSKFIDLAFGTWGRERCLKSGIVRQMPWGLVPFVKVISLLFPFYGEDGKIKNICGRYMGEVKEKKNRFLYIPNLDNDIKIFNLNNLVKTDKNVPVFISEGLTDCLALLSEGKMAVAIPGAGAFKPEYVEYFRGRTLFMYPDHDEPGKIFFESVNESLRNISHYVTVLPYDENCKDYSEFHLKMTNSNE